jgi:hypothetical protein
MRTTELGGDRSDLLTEFCDRLVQRDDLSDVVVAREASSFRRLASSALRGPAERARKAELSLLVG